MPISKELIQQLREMAMIDKGGWCSMAAVEFTQKHMKALLDEIERLQGEAESNKRMLDMLKTGLQEGMTNDPKEWWEDMIANWPNKPATSNEIRDIINCTRSRFKEEVIKALEGMKHKGPGGHGECCVCQTCKFPYDECMCTYNQALQEAIEIIKKL